MFPTHNWADLENQEEILKVRHRYHTTMTLVSMLLLAGLPVPPGNSNAEWAAHGIIFPQFPSLQASLSNSFKTYTSSCR